MKISCLVGSSVEGRTGAQEAGAGQGRDTKPAGSRQWKRVLLIRKVFRYLLSVGLITQRPNRLVALLAEAEKCQVELQQRDHHLWNNLSIPPCLTIECSN